MPYRILVTGTRENAAAYRDAVWTSLDSATFWITDHVVVVHGDCPYGGVDKYAEEWSLSRPGASPEAHPAEIANGKIKGPERNSRMVALGADLCLGFPGPKSRGTWDCLKKAVDAGIPTQVVVLRGS